MNSRATLAKNLIFTLVWFVAGTAVARPQTPRFTKQSPHSFSGKGFVLLQNGNVLSGKIETNADRVSVQLDGNSTIKLEHKQIEIIGESIEALYQHQVKGIRQWGTGEHWHMAHWCIKQELLDKAIVHYQEIEKTVPTLFRYSYFVHLAFFKLFNSEGHFLIWQTSEEQRRSLRVAYISEARASKKTR